MDDVKVALAELLEESGPSKAAPAGARRARRPLWALLALAAIGIGAAAWAWLDRQRPSVAQRLHLRRLST
jgi:hypothetical protein